jgi:hypothetical protein
MICARPPNGAGAALTRADSAIWRRNHASPRRPCTSRSAVSSGHDTPDNIRLMGAVTCHRAGRWKRARIGFCTRGSTRCAGETWMVDGRDAGLASPLGREAGDSRTYEGGPDRADLGLPVPPRHHVTTLFAHTRRAHWSRRSLLERLLSAGHGFTAPEHRLSCVIMVCRSATPSVRCLHLLPPK